MLTVLGLLAQRWPHLAFYVGAVSEDKSADSHRKYSYSLNHHSTTLLVFKNQLRYIFWKIGRYIYTCIWVYSTIYIGIFFSCLIILNLSMLLLSFIFNLLFENFMKYFCYIYLISPNLPRCLTTSLHTQLSVFSLNNWRAVYTVSLLPKIEPVLETGGHTQWHSIEEKWLDFPQHWGNCEDVIDSVEIPVHLHCSVLRC